LKATRKPVPARTAPSRELAKLRARLAAADETIRAIRNGEVDTVLGVGKKGPQVFTLAGAEHAYRVLIESMNEGALTLTADKTILYANHSFACMVRCPLEQVTGSSFRRFLSFANRASLKSRMKQAADTGSKLQVHLIAKDGSRLPVQISIQKMAKVGSAHVTISMVVTDMTESRRNEAQLRALAQRVVQVQEAERGRVALELHDNVTQSLCAALFISQALAAGLSARDGPVKKEAEELRRVIGQTAGEVERISRNLRPSVLDQLGLAAALRATGEEFTERTGVPLTLVCLPLTARLTPDTKLALYRIFQDALRNVEMHARARHVTVSLKPQDGFVEMVISDDGLGFDASRHTDRTKGPVGLGLLGMLERAAYVGGTLVIKSERGTSTEITVSVPL